MSGLVEFLSQLMTFIWDMVTGFIDLLLLIGRSVGYMFGAVASLPPYFKIAVIPIISIAVVLMVTDRG